MPGFRHYSSLAFDLRTPVSLEDFSAHLDSLVAAGCDEVELAGRVLPHARQRARRAEAVQRIRAAGARPVLYTSAFGSDTRPDCAQWAQRDHLGAPLGYLGSRRALMMCPRSPYVRQAAEETAQAVESAGFEAIFIDIPWILKGGCHCDFCAEERAAGLGRDELIRRGLADYCALVRDRVGDLRIGANVGAPGLHREGPSPKRVATELDEVVTEWNPYRWTQGPAAVARCLRRTAREVDARTQRVHATTCTNRRGQLLSPLQLDRLFSTIDAEGARLRIGLGRPALGPVLAAISGRRSR